MPKSTAKTLPEQSEPAYPAYEERVNKEVKVSDYLGSRLYAPAAEFILILGDSAPYGVHIPTEDFLGRIGIGLGFRNYYVQKLRARGEKWKGNPQRHHVALKESVLTLEK